MASEVLRKSRHGHNRRPWQTLQRLMSRSQCDRKHVLSAGDCRNMEWRLQRQRFQIKHIACRNLVTLVADNSSVNVMMYDF